MTGLRYGKITPTDIDAFLDFGGRVFIVIEAKHGTAMPPYGQKLALERMADGWQRAGIEALVLIASHNTDGDIVYHTLPVVQFRFRGQWYTPKQAITVREAIDRFRKWFAEHHRDILS